MNRKSIPSREGRGAFLALLWLGATSAMGCTQCSPTGNIKKFGELGTTDQELEVAPEGNAVTCSSFPDAPTVAPDVPTTCRYWVANSEASKMPCKDIAAKTKAGVVWKASSAFDGEAVATGLLKYCNYEWSDATSNPSADDVNVLPPVKSANCTYITPQQVRPDRFSQWAHSELLPPLGERLPASGAPETVDRKVRVVVLDTAPARDSTTMPSRHGRTLTQLIRESSCQNPSDCEVEVRSALAMPRILDAAQTPQIMDTGGNFGLLSDLTLAVWRETNRYRQGIALGATRPEQIKRVPARVIFNESFGFGNTDKFSNRCSTTAPPVEDPAARALFDSMMAASCLGILHVAAAGNHTGGHKYSEGLLCPARWDHAISPQESDCAGIWGVEEWKNIQEQFSIFSAKKNERGTPLAFSPQPSAKAGAGVKPNPTDSLLSVGGVDYNGMPIVLTRPEACPEALAIGIGGTSMSDSQGVPPFLFGTSVSAAVASSRIAIQWAHSLAITAGAWQYSDGVTRTPFARKGGLCGGTPVSCSDLPWIGKPATAIVGQNNNWVSGTPETIWPGLNPPVITKTSQLVCLDKLPHCNRPARAITADVWPQPVDPVCIKCGIYLPIGTTRSYPELWIEPNLSFPVRDTGAVLVVENPEGVVVHTARVSYTMLTTSSRTQLSGIDKTIFKDARVWLSGYDKEGRSYSQQIFVDQE